MNKILHGIMRKVRVMCHLLMFKLITITLRFDFFSHDLKIVNSQWKPSVSVIVSEQVMSTKITIVLRIFFELLLNHDPYLKANQRKFTEWIIS